MDSHRTCKTESQFSEADLLNQIADLQKLVTNLTEANKNSRDKEMSWLYAMEGNRDGVWDWNALTNEVFFSRRWKEMLGFQDHELKGNLSEWEKRLHPDDRDSVYQDLYAHLKGETPFYESEHRLKCKDGNYKWILDRGKIISWTKDGKPLRVVGTHSDIDLRKKAEMENKRLIKELKLTLAKVQVLKGLLPICASCKKIRDDQGYWKQIETYISEHSDAEFSHGLCPDCELKYFPEQHQSNPS